MRKAEANGSLESRMQGNLARPVWERASGKGVARPPRRGPISPLKRAAVKLGIGRFLYKLPAQWVDYDPQAKRFLKMPTLPAWALPAAKQPA